MKKNSLIYMRISMLAFTVLLCACQGHPSVPDDTSKNKEPSSLASVSYTSDAEAATAESVAMENDNLKKLGATDGQHIERHAEIGDFTLNYDCDVDLPGFQTDELYSCLSTPKKVDEEFLTILSEQYFGEPQTIEFDGVTYTLKVEKDSEKYSLIGSNMVYTLSGKNKNLCDWSSNRYCNLNDSGLSIDLDKAISECDEFISGIGRDNYSYNCVQAYGKDIGEDFFILTYSIVENGIYVYNNEASKLKIYYTDKGIYSIIGCLFELTKDTVVNEPVTLDKAIETVEKNIRYLGLYGSDDYSFRYLTNENGEILNYDIYKITLEYVYKSSYGSLNLLVPAWRFYFGTDGNIDYDHLLAVDIMDGALITK